MSETDFKARSYRDVSSSFLVLVERPYGGSVTTVVMFENISGTLPISETCTSASNPKY